MGHSMTIKHGLRRQTGRAVLLWLATEVPCVILAFATAASLGRVTEVVRRSPFGWADAVALAAAVLYAVSCWGFFRLLADLFGGREIGDQHPGHLAWWLAGGIWVSAAGVDIVVERSSHDSDAVTSVMKLGAVLASPLLLPLLAACLSRSGRSQAGWRAWAGFAVSCLLPVQYLVVVFVRT